MGQTLTVGGLFDGCGLLAYGLHLAGLEHRWLCEKDEFRAGLLEQRFPGIPVYRDVRDVGADAEPVDVIAGGFPCKGVSVAGQRAGFDHPETALWREQLRIVRELRPRYVLVENVAALLTMRDGELFGEVVGGLAACGYDTEWDCFPAAAFGAPHGRDRVFITAAADPGGARLEGAGVPRAAADGTGAAADTASLGREPEERRSWRGRPEPTGRDSYVADPVVLAGPTTGERDTRPRKGSEPSTRGETGTPLDRATGCSRGFEWGKYERAIERWERILGQPAPQPLISRVDHGRTASMDRPRVSAIGDGVLVQAGWLCGRRIVEHAEELTAA